MRKALETVVLAALAFDLWDAYGLARLPERIPTHFDLAGHATGWSTPSSLGVIPAMSRVISHLARHPEPATYSWVVLLPVGMAIATAGWFTAAMLKAGRAQTAV